MLFRSYPVQAADIAGLSVLVAADPWNLSRRMRAVEERLVGARSMDIAIDASAVAKRGFDCLEGVEAGGSQQAAVRVGLWEFPWEVLVRRQGDAARVQAAVARELAVMSVQITQSTGGDAVGGRRATRVVRPLYAARIREFRGDLDGPQGAKTSYLAARPGRQALAEHGIACEVVPGISSAIGAPASAGIPVTYRGLSASFTVVTGHRQRGETPVNWEEIGRAHV